MNLTLTAIYLAVFSWHSVCADCNWNNNPVIGIDFNYNCAGYTLLILPNSQYKQSVLFSKR